MIKKFFIILIFVNGAITYKTQAISWQEWVWGTKPAIQARQEETRVIVEKNDVKLLQAFLEKHKNDEPALAKITLDTAYLWAINKGFKHLALIALKNGADKNAHDNSGNTALHHAVMYAALTRNTQLIPFLIEQGVAYKKNNSGQTPAMLAHGHRKIFYSESGKEVIISQEIKEKIITQLYSHVVEKTDKAAQENEHKQANIQQQILLENRLKAQVLSLDITRAQAQEKLSATQKNYEILARQAGDLSQQRKKIEREILVYQLETKKLNTVKAEKNKLREELDRTDIAIAEQRKSNEKNRVIIEQELKELRALIEQKNRKRAELQQEEQALKQQESSLQRSKQEVMNKNHTQK